MRRFFWPTILTILGLVLLACWGTFGLLRRLPAGSGVYPLEWETPLVVMALFGFVIESAIFPLAFFAGTLGLDYKGYAKIRWQVTLAWVIMYLVIALCMPYFWTHWQNDPSGRVLDTAKNVLAALSTLVFVAGIFSR